MHATMDVQAKQQHKGSQSHTPESMPSQLLTLSLLRPHAQGPISTLLCWCHYLAPHLKNLSRFHRQSSALPGAYFRKHSTTTKVSTHPPSVGAGSLQGIVAAALLSANPQPMRPTGASRLVSSNGEVACDGLRNCWGNPCDARCHNGMQLRSGVV